MKFLSCTLLALFIALPAMAGDKSKLLPAGKEAKKFLIKDLAGKRKGLRDYVGKKAVKKKRSKDLLLISFWSVSCIPCRKEMPILQKFAEKHKDKVHLLFINLDSRDSENKVKEFIGEYDIRGTILLDIYQTAGKSYGVCEKNSCNVPALFGLSPNGIVKFSLSGFEDEKKIVSYLESQLLAKTPVLSADKKDDLSAQKKFNILHSALKSIDLKGSAKSNGIAPATLVDIFKEAEAAAKAAWEK